MVSREKCFWLQTLQFYSSDKKDECGKSKKAFFISNLRCRTHDKVPSRSNRRQREREATRADTQRSNNAVWVIHNEGVGAGKQREGGI